MQKLDNIANDIDIFSTLPFCPKVRVLVALTSLLVREPKFPSSLKVSLSYLFYYIITYTRIMYYEFFFLLTHFKERRKAQPRKNSLKYLLFLREQLAF